MAGRIIRVVSRRRVILTSNVALTNDQEILIATHVDVSQWREIVAYVRVHSPSTVTAGSWTTSPRLTFYYDGYTTEDPAFVNLGATGFVLPLPTAASGAGLAVGALPSNLGGLLTIGVLARPSGAATCDAWLSVDLSGKE
jgi:hypothetical protein